MSLKGSVSSDEAETNKEEMYDSEDEMRPNEVKDCLADLVDSLHYEIFSLYRTTKALRLL